MLEPCHICDNRRGFEDAPPFDSCKSCGKPTCDDCIGIDDLGLCAYCREDAHQAISTGLDAGLRTHNALACAMETLKHIAETNSPAAAEHAYDALNDINKILKGEA